MSSILNKKSRLKDKYLKDWVIHLLFLITSLAISFFIYIYKGVPLGDGIFNYLRMNDISTSIYHLHFPSFNIYTGFTSGIATNTFYPYLLLIPAVLLVKFVSIKLFFGLFLTFIVLFSQELTFFTFKHFTHYTLFSFLIAIFYMLTPIMLGHLSSYDFGALIAYSLYPALMISWLRWLYYGKWKMLCIMITLISYANLPGMIITAFILFLLTLLNLKIIKKEQIINGIKSIIVYIFLISFYLIPMLWISKSNSIYFPYMNHPLMKAMSKPVIFKPLIEFLRPTFYTTWGILDILSIVLSLIFWKKIPYLLKTFFLIGILLLFLNLYPVQLFLISHTLFNHIQFMARFSMFEHLFFITALTYITCFLLVKRYKRKTLLTIIDIMITCALLVCCYSGLLERQNNEMLTTFNPNSRINRDAYTSFLNHTTFSKKLVPAQTFSKKVMKNKLTKKNSLMASYSDYAPTDTLNRKISLKHTKHLYFSYLNLLIPPYLNIHDYRNNGFNINERNSKTKLLPLLIYHGQNYNIYNNKREQHYTTYKHYLRIHLHRGINRIRIRIPIMWYRIIGLILSIIGIGLIILLH